MGFGFRRTRPIKAVDPAARGNTMKVVGNGAGNRRMIARDTAED
jgi:hypothetical protein